LKTEPDAPREAGLRQSPLKPQSPDLASDFHVLNARAALRARIVARFDQGLAPGVFLMLQRTMPRTSPPSAVRKNMCTLRVFRTEWSSTGSIIEWCAR
jgi:hypothetical protein